jgi:hypothetical protein
LNGIILAVSHYGQIQVLQGWLWNYGDDIWITASYVNLTSRIVPYSSSGLVGDWQVFNVYTLRRFVIHRGDRYKQYIHDEHVVCRCTGQFAIRKYRCFRRTTVLRRYYGGHVFLHEPLPFVYCFRTNRLQRERRRRVRLGLFCKCSLVRRSQVPIRVHRRDDRIDGLCRRTTILWDTDPLFTNTG